MSKIAEAEELPFVFDGSEDKFRRALAYTKEERSAAEAPEVKQEREGKLKQSEADRRDRSEKIFNKDWWTRKEAINWVAKRDKHSLERRRGAVLYDADSLHDTDPTRSFNEAISDGLVKEYPNDPALYRSEQVKAAFPAPGQCRTTEDAAFNSRQPRRRAPSLVDRLAKELKTMYPSGKPALKHKQIGRALEQRLGAGFGDTTLKKAIGSAFKSVELDTFRRA